VVKILGRPNSRLFLGVYELQAGSSAHVVHVNDDEIQILKQREVGVGHCPQSNMKLASGVAPIPQMLRAGLRVGLGTDGAASNNDLNLWEEMDTAAKLHKVFTDDPTVVSARQSSGVLILRGPLGSYYHKQLAQEMMSGVVGVVQVVNEIEVVDYQFGG
jgi:hypothetical protein